MFTAAIEEKSGKPFVSFHHGLADEWEGYKQRIYREGRARLAWAKWKRADIGNGRILETVIRAIEIHENAELRNNLATGRPSAARTRVRTSACSTPAPTVLSERSATIYFFDSTAARGSQVRFSRR